MDGVAYLARPRGFAQPEGSPQPAPVKAAPRFVLTRSPARAVTTYTRVTVTAKRIGENIADAFAEGGAAIASAITTSSEVRIEFAAPVDDGYRHLMEMFLDAALDNEYRADWTGGEQSSEPCDDAEEAGTSHDAALEARSRLHAELVALRIVTPDASPGVEKFVQVRDAPDLEFRTTNRDTSEALRGYAAELRVLGYDARCGDSEDVNLTGETFEIRAALKKRGARWSGSHWTIRGDLAWAVQDEIDSGMLHAKARNSRGPEAEVEAKRIRQYWEKMRRIDDERRAEEDRLSKERIEFGERFRANKPVVEETIKTQGLRATPREVEWIAKQVAKLKADINEFVSAGDALDDVAFKVAESKLEEWGWRRVSKEREGYWIAHDAGLTNYARARKDGLLLSADKFTKIPAPLLEKFCESLTLRVNDFSVAGSAPYYVRDYVNATFGLVADERWTENREASQALREQLAKDEVYEDCVMWMRETGKESLFANCRVRVGGLNVSIQTDGRSFHKRPWAWDFVVISSDGDFVIRNAPENLKPFEGDGRAARKRIEADLKQGVAP